METDASERNSRPLDEDAPLGESGWKRNRCSTECYRRSSRHRPLQVKHTGLRVRYIRNLPGAVRTLARPDRHTLRLYEDPPLPISSRTAIWPSMTANISRMSATNQSHSPTK